MNTTEIFKSIYGTEPPPANLKTKGFVCRKCGGRTKVKETRSYQAVTFRYRKCLACQETIITEERVKHVD